LLFLSKINIKSFQISGTISQNILFGLAKDKRRYRDVIKKCALQYDLSLLPQGDDTIIGEKGAALSGGLS
jgi:ATP-binding cassette, subfamily C (CFTR/MRP), member 4